MDDCVNLTLYIAQGKLPVGYHCIFDISMSTLPDLQCAMTTALDTGHVRWIGVSRSLSRKPLLGNPPSDTTLNDHIHNTYVPLCSFECPPRNLTYEVYERRSP